MRYRKDGKKESNGKTPDAFLKKMSWCTLGMFTHISKYFFTFAGYQYDWTNRKYHQQQPVPFPKDIATLTCLVAHATGAGPYRPEAAIVNYYKTDGSMGGHLDNAEYEMKKPIISIRYFYYFNFLNL